MTTPDKQLWQGLAAEAQTALVMRDYALANIFAAAGWRGD